MLIYMIKSTQDEEMETCAQIGEECTNFSYWRNCATMDLNHGTFEAWNLPVVLEKSWHIA